MLRSALVLAAAGLALLGCRDTTAPLGDVYVLRSIASVPLPAPWAPSGVPNRMIADTLYLRADGRGEMHAVKAGEDAGTVQREIDALTYVVTGGRIEVSFVCPDLADCIAPPHLSGTLSDSGIVFDVSKVTRAPLVFERR